MAPEFGDNNEDDESFSRYATKKGGRTATALRNPNLNHHLRLIGDEDFEALVDQVDVA